jgi:hypothetical protein
MIGFINAFIYNLCYNQSQQLAINDCLRLASFSFSFLFCTSTTTTSELYSLITTLHGPHGKHSLYCCQSLFTAPLPSNRSPIVPRVFYYGNVLSDPLPCNGHGADHIENTSCITFSVVACAYFGRCLEMGLYVTVC